LFQYYLTTPLFQKYWTIPEFQTFFSNPYLFYKYVYPVVYNTHHQSSIYDVDSYYPTTSSYNRYDVDRVLDNGVYDKDSVLSQYRNVYPVDSVYNKYNTIYGQQYPTTTFNRNHYPYRSVMDKIFKHHYVNRPSTEVVTDVKVFDNKVDEQTIGKYVDPIIGEYKYNDYKIVDGKIVPVVGERVIDDIVSRRPIDQLVGEYPVDRLNKYNIFEGKHMNVKDALLKRLLLNKMTYGDRKIDELYPEYTTETRNIPILEKIEKLNKLNRLENIVEKINGVDKFDKYEKIDDLIRTPTFESGVFRNKDLLTRVPLTKEMKDFDFEMPTTKNVIV